MTDARFNLASLGQRLGGAIIDGVIEAALMLGAMWALGLPFTQQTWTDRAVEGVLGLVVLLVVQGYLLHKRGQTIGKIVMGTRIVDLHGNLRSIGPLLGLRYVVLSLAALIPYVGRLLVLVDILFIFGSDRRCLHDYLAGTKVVDLNSPILVAS